MKLSHILWLFLTLTLPLTAGAETKATRLLDRVVEQINSPQGISLSFILRQGDMPDATGTIDMQENRFKIDVDEMTTWFDGTTQWTYLKPAGEVNISLPGEEELTQTNPYLLLQNYKTTFDCRFIGKKGNVCELALLPREESEITEIHVFIEEKQSVLSRLVVTQRGSQNSEITITRYETDPNFSEKHFVFGKEHYPQAIIIDLR